jgi:hypothetical protein
MVYHIMCHVMTVLLHGGLLVSLVFGTCFVIGDIVSIG